MRAVRSVWRILNQGHGHWRSVVSTRPVDGRGEPIPWFTYPAIEFLVQFDFSRLRVFEFGAGQSTLFWEKRAESVTSVESNPKWHDRVRAGTGATVTLHLREDPAGYVACLREQADEFDVIVVDGIERLACSQVAVAKLRAGGMIILDNSDRHPRCAAVLRDSGLLQVDMTGFGPVNGYAWTTSFFFHRGFDFPMSGATRPKQGIGALPDVHD